MGKGEEVVKIAEDYYDSEDADSFYFKIWGGVDIHVGLYDSDSEPIADASARTVETMAERIKHLPEGSRVLDLGAGYGGSGRYLAKKYGYHVTCLNLSEIQNERNRKANLEEGLSDKVDVVYGNFEDLPFEDESFDLIWSQDAFLHSGRRKLVLEEAKRVLKAGGEMIFTDPMQAENVNPEILAPVLNRIHLDTMGSFSVYRQFADELGFEVIDCEDLTPMLVMHYSRVREELQRLKDAGELPCSDEFAERMIEGLGHWVSAGGANALNWGIIHFKKK